MSNLKRFLLISTMVIIIGGFIVITYHSGGFRFPHDDVTISNFTICKTEDPQSKIPLVDGSIISSSYSELYACGYLTTNNSVRLRVYLYKSNISLPIYSSAFERSSRGNFSIELKLPTDERKGSYRLEVYYFRKILASQTFDIGDP